MITHESHPPCFRRIFAAMLGECIHVCMYIYDFVFDAQALILLSSHMRACMRDSHNGVDYSPRLSVGVYTHAYLYVHMHAYMYT
jgi:hypothetical protein